MTLAFAFCRIEALQVAFSSPRLTIEALRGSLEWFCESLYRREQAI